MEQTQLSDLQLAAHTARVCREALLLDEAARVAMRDPAKARELLGEIEKTGLLSYLRDGVVMLIHKTLLDGRVQESDIRDEFYKNLERYLPGAHQTTVEIIRRNIPDGFVEWKRRECPVEVKLTVFDDRALKQLHRYMTVYDAEMGIAVAPKLKCELPANIHFVEVHAP
ncbi:hypothetical protein EN781_00265 [Mesorhizobium sp. M4A.F.Ca.ET.090.04.2.1]|uniref:hypothetical protein n=1 Tax=Mesorhizobium sp. M4A.F.Ca.ET.090.04.2.1 TaxID=2496663 RepID=UPI000FD2D979|nr:hypothetical protein [Mesorhizobium sp. M4A.F.Ca.ET.090.04.2.1]RVC47605.1 hypothetical protein EN781_00265 [Mesorhizobium sp. M4A.F.Ca.ET.090.04.2.1]